MTNSVSISYIFSSYVELTRTCHQNCGYCSFVREDDPLLPISEVKTRVEDLARRGATEIIFIAGESPQDFPHIQIALHQNGFTSFADYLNEVCRISLAAQVLPVLEIGYLDSFSLERFVNAGCSIRVNLVCAALSTSGQALENSRGRNPSAGKAFIESLHTSGIPYSLGFIVGIGESEEERLKFIAEIGRYCTADPLLQDVRLIPFQPSPACKMPDRPPLPFASIQKTIVALRELFPVHYLSLPPHLFHRFPELVESGLNDLGSLPILTGDPCHGSFEVPCLETIKTRLEQRNVLLYERGSLTTPIAVSRPEIFEALASGRKLIERRNLSRLNLIDNDHCFVCGPRNKGGLHIPVKKHVEGHTCSFTWAPGPAYQSYAGIVHGGILCTLLDEAMGYAVMGSRHDLMVVTADMQIRYLKPTPVGVPLKFAATLVGQRKNMYFARSSVILPDGTVLAEAEGRFAEIILPGDKK